MKLDRESKIGLFTIVALTTLYFGYNFLRGKKFFADVKEYFVVFNSIEGVVKSTPVYYKGLKVGQVEKFALLKADSANKILATLSIDGKIKVSKSTAAVIVNMDLLGSKAIKLEIPDLNFILNEGDTLFGVDEEDFLMPIKDKSERVLMNIDKLLTELNTILINGGRENISSGIKDLSLILHNLKSTTEQLNTFIARKTPGISKAIDNAEQVSASLKNSSQSLVKISENLANISDSLRNAPVKQSIENLKAASAEINHLVQGINNGEGTLGLLANDTALYHNLNLTAANLHSLLKDIETYPARYVHVSVFGSTAKKAERKREQDKLRKK